MRLVQDSIRLLNPTVPRETPVIQTVSAAETTPSSTDPGPLIESPAAGQLPILDQSSELVVPAGETGSGVGSGGSGNCDSSNPAIDACSRISKKSEAE